MADWFGSQALQTDELWLPSRAACSGAGESGSILQVALNWQPHIMQKRFISHRLSGQTKWIHFGFIQPVMPETLCHQHTWRRACWGLQTRNSKTRASLANVESLRPCLTKLTVCQDHRLAVWKPCRCRGLAATLLWKAMVRGYTLLPSLLNK